jgi:hypothetical protein
VLSNEWDNIPELDSWADDEDYFEPGSTTNEAIYDDLPGLDPLSDSEDEGDDMPGLEVPSDSEDEDDDMPVSDSEDEDENPLGDWPMTVSIDDETIIEQIKCVLTRCQPFPGDGVPVDMSYRIGEPRFIVERQDRGLFCIYDRVQGFETDIHEDRLQWGLFSIGRWFAERCTENMGLHAPWDRAHRWVSTKRWEETLMGPPLRIPNSSEEESGHEEKRPTFELGGIQVERNKYPALQRNAAQVKGNQRVLPKPLIVKVSINGHPARALLDS